MIEQAKWDKFYSHNQQSIDPSQVLYEHAYLLPKQGKALDLACGLGGNALFLARLGLKVDAWDISSVALTRLQTQADQISLPITTWQCDIRQKILPLKHYDVIVISRFLDRSLCNAIMGALKPEGLLFYQTFTRNKLDQHGPSNPDYLLGDNELLSLFPSLSLVFYQEYARIGDWRYGNRNEACFIGQKF